MKNEIKMNGKRKTNNKPIYNKDQEKVTRVLLIDSCLVFRDSLAFSISECQDIKVVGLAAAAAQVCETTCQGIVDVAVIDVDLLDQSGIELCKWLISRYPNMSLLLLSDNDWEVYLVAAQRVYTAGLLLRNSPTSEIIQSLRQAKNGSLYSADQLQRLEDWNNNIGLVLKSLSHREWNVLWQVTTGFNNREIAQNLNISENSIEKYLTGLYQRFGVSTRAALMVLIYRSHLDVFNKLDDSVRMELLAG